MISSSKAGWHLPFALLTVTFLLYVSLGLWFSEWVTASQARPAHALDGILSPETIDALYEDARLHHAILGLTETVAKASLTYGDTFESGGLKDFGKSLSAKVARFRTTDRPTKNKRQLSNSTTQDAGLLAGLMVVLGELGNATGMGDTLQQGLATPAYFMGIGLG